MTHPRSSSPDKGWSEYWSNDGASGEVFVNAEGKAHPEIARWWRQAFSQLPPTARIVDLACGAGSVFAHLPPSHGYKLSGADISADALDLLRTRLPGVQTSVCSVDSLDYADQSFDLVVSQFGIEYAGIHAFSEAARIVAPGGRLQVLCHIADGYIDARNARHLKYAQLAARSGFIDLAMALIEAAFGNDAALTERCTAAFAPVESALALACKDMPQGIHAHLLNGFRQLYACRTDYYLHDIVKWLEDMRADMDLNIHRLSHMRQAAQSASDMQAIRALLQKSGLAEIQCQPFQISTHALPLAWTLQAQRA